MAAASLQLSLVPGTPKEQRELARSIMIRRGMPIEIKKEGRKWAVIVLGVTIGFVNSKGLAQSAAHQVGAYRLQLGDFAYTYVKGYGDRNY